MNLFLLVLGKELVSAFTRGQRTRADMPIISASFSRPNNMLGLMIASPSDAYALLKRLGAPRHLIRHLQLVGDAVDELLRGYQALKIPIDALFVRLGVAVHDAGKILHPEELLGPGSQHEEAGRALLVKHGVQPKIAQCCISHAAWQQSNVTFEERTIAIADKLWKGKRESGLEMLVVDEAARKIGKDRWDLFIPLDSLFEDIASKGVRRLAQSK